MTLTTILTAYALVILSTCAGLIAAGYARGPVRTSHKLRTDPRFLIADGDRQQVFSPLHVRSNAR